MIFTMLLFKIWDLPGVPNECSWDNQQDKGATKTTRIGDQSLYITVEKDDTNNWDRKND